MPYTVPVSFDKFIENISLTGDHQDVANTRKDRIVSLLGNTFEILDAFPTGSIPKGTALKGQADLDVMTVLHYGKHIKGKSPAQVLQDVRDALGEYRTNVRKNGQAVTLYYESWPNVDIVPVSRTVNDNGTVNHYNVPDMNTGTWLPSRPRRHATAINEKATECGKRFKPLIRMVKQWNKEHSDLMESYHIEVLALNICSGELADYSWEVFHFFDEAVKLVQAPLPYEGGNADEYLDYATRQEVLKRLRTAKDRASDAWYLTYNGQSDHERAIEIWRQIFGSKFPAYG
jgi:hypothetical protein